MIPRFGFASVSVRYRDLSVRYGLGIGKLSAQYRFNIGVHRLVFGIYHFGIRSVSARYRDLWARCRFGIRSASGPFGSISARSLDKSARCRHLSVRCRLGMGSVLRPFGSVSVRYRCVCRLSIGIYRLGVGSVSARCWDLSVRFRFGVSSVSISLGSVWAWYRLGLGIDRPKLWPKS